MYDFLDTSTPNSGLGTPLRSGGEIINANFRKLHAWMEARSNIATSTIPTLAAGGPRYLVTAEFVPGSPMPLTLYERTGTAPSDVTNPAWAQSVDLQWWKLVPQGGTIYIEQFGGKNDANQAGTTGTDNYGPLFKACAYSAWEVNAQRRFVYELRFGPGHYLFSDTLEFHVCVPIRGIGGAFESAGATYWHFPANKTFVIIGNNISVGETTVGSVGIGESAGLSIENITMQGKATSTDHARAGIHVRTLCHLKHIQLMYVGGDGFRVIAGTGAGTIADFTTIAQCSVHSCSRDALRIDGNDANVCHISDFSAHGPSWKDGDPINGGVGGCGIYDSASFGNKYDNIHLAGFGNRGVHHLGRAYRLLTYSGERTGAPGPGETTTPGTNDNIWYDVGALASPNDQFPAWSATPTVPHRPQIPFLTNGATHVIDNLYVETGAPCHLPNATVCYLGTAGGTRYSNMVLGSDSGIINNNGWMGIQRYEVGQPGYTYNGASTSVAFGQHFQSDSPEKGIGILTLLNEGVHPAKLSWRYFDKEIIFTGVSKRYWEQTTWATTRTFGRSTAQPDFLVIPDVVLSDPGNANAARVLGMRDVPPDSGSHGTGETFIMTNPLGYGCWAVTYSVAGNPGTSVTVPVFGLTSVNPQRNGDLVVECTSNTQMKFKYKGTDGTIRTASLTLS